MRLPTAVVMTLVLAVGCGEAPEDGPATGNAAGPATGNAAATAAPAWRTLAPATLARTEVADAGGFERDSGTTTAATERYDIRRDRWTRVADMPVGLNHAAAAAYKGRVYVVGGYRGRRRVHRSLRGS